MVEQKRTPSIIRKSDVRARLGGVGNSQIARDVQAGVLTPAISIGKRAVGWPDTEIDAIVGARIAGLPAEKIRELVTHLVGERQRAAPIIPRAA